MFYIVLFKKLQKKAYFVEFPQIEFSMTFGEWGGGVSKTHITIIYSLPAAYARFHALVGPSFRPDPGF